MPGTRSTRSATKRKAVEPPPARSPPAKNPTKKAKTKVEPKHELLYDEIQYDVDEEIEMDEKGINEQKVVKIEEKVKIPPSKSGVIDDTNFAKINNQANATDGKCGHCEGCVRSPCQECSACKRLLYGECIDLYCSNERTGITERVNLREMYLKRLKMQKEEQNQHSSDEDSSEDDDDEKNQGKEDRDISEDDHLAVNKNLESPQKKQRNFNSAVYGGSSRALKTRRCGECEGCTKDDCGTCTACKDKPRFGGKGSKKKACTHRYCRLKTLYQS